MRAIRVLIALLMLLGLHGIAPAQGTNANLRSVGLYWNTERDSGPIDIQFDPATTTYTASVPSSLNAIYIEWAAEESAAVVRLNGAEVDSEDGRVLPVSVADLPLDLRLEVTSADGSTARLYVFTFTAAVRTNPAIRQVEVAPGTLVASFDPAGAARMRVRVSGSQATVSITATPAVPTTIFTVAGLPARSGVAVQGVPLPLFEPAVNEIPIRATAEDGVTTRDYVIEIVREGGSDTSLSGLTVSGAELNPAFSPLQLTYDVRGELGAPVTFTPTASDPRARVMFISSALPKPVEIPRGGNTPPILLPSQSRGVSFQVIAQDGTSEFYSAYLLGLSSNATLFGPGISGGRLFPGFDSTIQEYEFRLQSTETSVTVAPIPMQPSSTIRVNGQPVAPGQVAGPIDVSGSPPPIEIEVTSQVGTVRTYRFSLTRNAPPEIAAPPSVTLLEDTQMVVPLDLRDLNDPAEDLLVFVQNTNLSLFDITAANSEVRTGGPVRQLRIVPNPDQAGEARYVLRVEDPVGEEQTVLINATVTPVNDPPRFDIERTNLQAEQGATRLTAMNLLRFVAPGPHSLAPGPHNEFDQQLTSLITVRPASGNLQVNSASFDIQRNTLTLDLNGQPGAVFIDLTFRDDGGTSNGGADTSVTKSLLVNMPTSQNAVDLSVAIARVAGNDVSATFEVLATNFGPAVAQGVRVAIPKPEGIDVFQIRCMVDAGSACVLSEEEGVTFATMDLYLNGSVRVSLDSNIPPETNFVQINAEVLAAPGTAVDNPFDDRAFFTKAVNAGLLRDGFEAR